MENDLYNVLQQNNCEEVAEHTKIVANAAKQLASRFGLNEEAAYIAGLLHDIGNIIPLEERVEFCNAFAVEVLEVEKSAPALLHSKISKIIAKNIFGVEEEICNAIECHSTLKANAAKLDLVLFVADKQSWESKYNKDFIEEMMEGLEVSLERAAFAYIKYLHNGKSDTLHPMTVEAFMYLEDIFNNA
jgi:predicted HD superfamily hydrolase involved in NAD metabolism